MRIAVAGDRVGVALADALVAHLKTRPGLSVTDLSPTQDLSEFYASVAERVASAILTGEFDRGILCCGTGIGMALAANKVPGIRAAQTHDTFSAERAAKSNDAHIIAIGARVVGTELAKNIADTWLASAFDPEGPSAANIRAVSALDAKYRRL